MTITYRPKGTCSTRFDIDLDGGVIRDIVIEGGCRGNLAGLRALLRGMKAEEAIQKLSGIPCHGDTSCPDQIAKALRRALEQDQTQMN